MLPLLSVGGVAGGRGLVGGGAARRLASADDLDLGDWARERYERNQA